MAMSVVYGIAALHVAEIKWKRDHTGAADGHLTIMLMCNKGKGA